MARDSLNISETFSDPHLREAEPCPFCGGSTLGMARGDKLRFGEERSWLVVCCQCLCRGPYGNAAKRAVDKWNGRFELAHPEEVSIDD